MDLIIEAFSLQLDYIKPHFVILFLTPQGNKTLRRPFNLPPMIG